MFQPLPELRVDTRKLGNEFFAITSGEKEAPGDWLAFVNK